MPILHRTLAAGPGLRMPGGVQCGPAVGINIFMFCLMKVTYLRINVLVSPAGIVLVVSAVLKM